MQLAGENILSAHTKEITAISLTMDGAWLVSAAKDGTLRLWDTGSCQCVKSMETKGDMATVVVVPAAFLRVPKTHVPVASIFQRTLYVRGGPSAGPVEFPEVTLRGPAQASAPSSLALATRLASNQPSAPAVMAVDSPQREANPSNGASGEGGELQHQEELARRWAQTASALYTHSVQGIIKAIVHR